MLEKALCDNAHNKVNTQFRHTISSSRRKRNLSAPECVESCKHEKPVAKGKKRKKRNKKSKGKLEGSRYCDYGEKTTENCCTRPQTAWARQRESYLDNVTWSSSDCPGYTSHLERLSRVENICKDPCNFQPSNCQTQSLSVHHPQCPLRSSEGRKRHPEIQPTPPAYICRPITPTKKPSPEKICKKKSKEKVKSKSIECPPPCCCCPEKKKEVPTVCTKETCPNKPSKLSKVKLNKNKPKEKKSSLLEETSVSDNTKCPPPCCYCLEKKKEVSSICTKDTCPIRKTSTPTDNPKCPPPCCCCPEKKKDTSTPALPTICTKETCPIRSSSTAADNAKCPPPCCCCPEKKKESPSPILSTICTKETCPIRRSLTASDNVRCPPPCCCCPDNKDKPSPILSAICTKETCPIRNSSTLTDNVKCSPTCCCCPDKKKDSQAPRLSTICTKDTCPNRNSSTTADNVRCPLPCCCCPEKKDIPAPNVPAVCTKETCPNRPPPVCASKCPPRSSALDLDCSRAVRFDAEQCAPRVAARFENGVLEAYSQFKVAFPPKSSEEVCPPAMSTKKLQTERNVCDCGVGRDSAELTVKCCCVKRRPSKRNASIGTQDSHALDKSFFHSRDCCCDNGDDSLESDQTMHDYVLLTPGGKYVPLVRTKSNQSEKVSFECCLDGGRSAQQQRAQEYCDNVVQTRAREEDKGGTTTTQLLLRCFEHVLCLEEQEEKGKSPESREDVCEPYKRKSQERRQSSESPPSEGCLPCLNEKQNQARAASAGSSRAKLTQNFLEILKCALEIDSKKNDCEEEAYRQDSCECDVTLNKVEQMSFKKSPISHCNESIGGDGQTMQDAILRDCCKSLSSRPGSAPLSSRPGSAPACSRPGSAQSNDKQKKCDQGTAEKSLTVCFDKSLNSECRIESPPAQKVKPAFSSKEIQCEETKVPVRSKGTQKRDTVLQYLVKCANRSENARSYQPSGRVFATAISDPRHSPFDLADKKSQGLRVVECDQFYQTYMVRPYKPPCEKTFDRRLKQFHNRICAIKRIDDP